jgi:predicted small secreted protein
MKRIGKAFPLIAATMLLAGCGSVEGVGPESVAVGATGGFAVQDGRSLPDWHSPLPPGHPPLPPGHPAVPEGLVTCPAGGVVREPDIDRFRDFKADPREVIRI